MFRRIACVLALCVSSLPADEAVQPSLTIYNQNFAVVRQELPLNLKAGPNKIQVTDITMHLEPDSVILRDPSGRHPIQVLEQNYRADPISESLLLSLNEGKTIDFLVQRENKQEVVTGKIIRSGYTPHNYMASREKDWGSRSFITQETLEIAGGAPAPHSHSLSPQQMPRFLVTSVLGGLQVRRQDDTTRALACHFDWNDVPDIFRDDVGGYEINFVLCIRLLPACAEMAIVRFIHLRSSRFHLHPQEASALLHHEVVACAVSPGFDDAQSQLGGARHETQLRQLSPQL